MISNVPINIKDILPESEYVFKHQGIPSEAAIPGHIYELYEDALDILKAKASPVGIIKNLSVEEFDNTFYGEGKNADDVLLPGIYRQANNLALFALTLGDKIVESINNLFSNNDFALAAMVDSVASVAAENSVEFFELYFLKQVTVKDNSNNKVVLGYSPGYCGWDMSGQKKLFQDLKPEKIGVTLNESFLMTPLKSVSGVLVHGKKKIHIFENKFSFCRYCKNRTCIDRMKKIMES